MVIYYAIITVAAVCIGLFLASIFKPGLGAAAYINSDVATGIQAQVATTIEAQKGNMLNMFLGFIPKNPLAAVSGGDMLPIIVFMGITDSLSGIKTGISGRISSINDNVTTFGKELSDKWTALVSKIQGSRISSDLTVNELEELWKKEIELEVGGAV